MYQNEFNPNAILQNPFEQNMAIIKYYFKRPLVLAYVIIGALGVIMSMAISVFISLKMAPELSNAIQQAIEESGSSYASQNIFSGMSANYFYVIFNLALGLLPFIGFLVVYIKSKNPLPVSNPSAGITLLWVMSIIRLIGACLISLVLVVSLIFISIVSTSYGNSSARFATFLFSIIFLIVIFFILFYPISDFRFYSSVRRSTTTLSLSYKGSKIYGVFSIIIGIITVIGSFSLLSFPVLIQGAMANTYLDAQEMSDINSIAQMALVMIIPSLLSATSYILLGAIALGYNKYIIRVINSQPINYPIPPMYGNSNPQANYARQAASINQIYQSAQPVNQPVSSPIKPPVSETMFTDTQVPTVQEQRNFVQQQQPIVHQQATIVQEQPKIVQEQPVGENLPYQDTVADDSANNTDDSNAQHSESADNSNPYI